MYEDEKSTFLASVEVKTELGNIFATSLQFLHKIFLKSGSKRWILDNGEGYYKLCNLHWVKVQQDICQKCFVRFGFNRLAKIMVKKVWSNSITKLQILLNFSWAGLRLFEASKGCLQLL